MAALDENRVKKIVAGAFELTWDHGGGSSSGDLSAMIPLLHKAFENSEAEELRQVLEKLGTKQL